MGVALAIAVSMQLWQGFRHGAPRPAAPRVPEAVLHLRAAPAQPVASLEFGGVVREGAPRSFCWDQGAGAAVCVETLEARLRPADYVHIPQGTTLRIASDARAVLITRSSARSAQGITVDGDRLDLDWEPGSYRVVASGIWTQGTVPFRFGIEITPPATCLSTDEPGLLTCEEALAAVLPTGNPVVGEPKRIESSLSWLRVRVGAEPVHVWRVRYLDAAIAIPGAEGEGSRGATCGRGDWLMTADARTARIYRSGISDFEPEPCPPRSGAEDRRDPWPEGVFGRHQADYPESLGYRFRSLWRGRIRGHRVAVYAGVRVEADERAVYRPTGEGAVLIKGWDPERGRRKLFTDYSTPIPGPVRIVAAEGHELTLRSLRDGSEIIFDVLTGTFHLP